MPTLKRKAFAYITHADQLLLFRHPAAPMQGSRCPLGRCGRGNVLKLRYCGRLTKRLGSLD